MKSSAKNIRLTSVDDLFSTQESREDAQREKVVEIALSQLHPFQNHPFQVRNDQAMQETAESIREYGVLVPAIDRRTQAASGKPACREGNDAGYYPGAGR